MAGRYFRTDAGKSFRSGAVTGRPRTNTNLSVRPEAGRTGNYRTGTPTGGKTTEAARAAIDGQSSNPLQMLGNAAVGLIGMSGIGATLLTLSQNATGDGDRQTKWKRLGYDSPEHYAQAMQDYETRTGKSSKTGQPLATPPTPRKVTPAGNYTVNGVTYDATTGQAINPDTGKTSSGGYSLDPKTGARTDYAAGTGRGADAPDGSGAQGTQTSPRQMTMDEANSLLTGGYKVQNPFSSTQLPDTSGSPYFGNGDTPEYRSDVPEDTYDVELASDMTTGSPFKQGDYKYEVPANTNIDYLQTSGAALLQTGGVVKASQNTESATEHPKSNIPKRPRGGRQAEMWDRKYGRMNQQPEPTESKSPNIDYARRAAFLDAPNSMQGLRRVEAQKGMVYAGGQHNMVNPNAGKDGQSDFIKVEKSDRDAYMGNRMTAKELKDKYVKQIGDDGKTIPEPRVNYSFDSPDVEDPDDSIKGTMDDLPKGWK